MSTTVTSTEPAVSTRKAASGGRAGDSVFSGLSLGAGVLILAVLAAVALFLFLQALPTFRAPAEEISGGEDQFQFGRRTVNARAYAAGFNFRGADQ